jgi:dolichol-phosphate mannosyltransferase
MISIVIPLLNEAPCLEQLHRELTSMGDAQGYDMQIIFVDDGSTDESWMIIRQLASTDPRVLGVKFRRNFGKAAALSAGFQEAVGEVIVTIDADLQDDPSEIPNLLVHLQQKDQSSHGRSLPGNLQSPTEDWPADQLDVVSGWKKKRHDPWHKIWPSRVFNRLVSWLTGVRLHDHNCGLKCFRREVMDEVRLYGELHRFVPVLAAARGFQVGELPVVHRARRYGVSKYGWARIPKGLLDLLTVTFITRFGYRPQHWLGMAGLASFLIGLGGMAYLAWIWSWSRFSGGEPVHLHQTAALYYALVALLIGSQLIAMGFVAEMITALFIRSSDTYSIAQKASFPVPASPPHEP